MPATIHARRQRPDRCRGRFAREWNSVEFVAQLGGTDIICSEGEVLFHRPLKRPEQRPRAFCTRPRQPLSAAHPRGRTTFDGYRAERSGATAEPSSPRFTRSTGALTSCSTELITPRRSPGTGSRTPRRGRRTTTPADRCRTRTASSKAPRGTALSRARGSPSPAESGSRHAARRRRSCVRSARCRSRSGTGSGSARNRAATRTRRRGLRGLDDRAADIGAGGSTAAAMIPTTTAADSGIRRRLGRSARFRRYQPAPRCTGRVFAIQQTSHRSPRRNHWETHRLRATGLCNCISPAYRLRPADRTTPERTPRPSHAGPRCHLQRTESNHQIPAGRLFRARGVYAP